MFKNLKSDSVLFEIREVSHNPQIIRQLVNELRIDAINKRFLDACLSKSNPKFIGDNGKFDYHKLENDYRFYKERMISTLTDNDHELKKLFKCSLNRYHRPIFLVLILIIEL